MTVEQEEVARAMRYRNQIANRVAFRANQLRALAGSQSARAAISANYRKVYDKTNYIPGQEGSFQTPFDYDDSGGISSSPIELPNTKQSRRKEP